MAGRIHGQGTTKTKFKMLKIFTKRPNRYVPSSFTYLQAMEMTPPFPPRCALTDVASYEGYNQLLWFGAFATWFGHNMLVQSFYCPFEAGKLHHGVRDLPQPQWWKTLVKSTRTKIIRILGIKQTFTKVTFLITLSYTFLH